MAKQWDVTDLGRRLQRYVRKLESDPKAAAHVVMQYAELTGQLIKKTETTVRDEQRALVQEAVKQLLAARLDGKSAVSPSLPTASAPVAPTTATPSLPMTNGVTPDAWSRAVRGDAPPSAAKGT